MEHSQTTNVGFIGLGKMGQPMAKRLMDAGFALVVHDVSKKIAEPLVEQGARWADTPSALAADCEYVCLSLPGPKEFENVMETGDGVLSGLKTGSICVDFTTNSPAVVKEMSSRVDQQGAALVDCPVSGGVEGAMNGNLTVLIGGISQSVEKARPVLSAVAREVVHTGPTGTASVCKVLHNCAVFASNLATVECLTAGIKAGVKPETVIKVFQDSGLGRNLDLNVAMPATLFQGKFEPRFAMQTARKDMGLATELARQCGVPMKLSEACESDMQEAIARGWGDRDNTIFLTLQEERAGVDVRAETT